MAHVYMESVNVVDALGKLTTKDTTELTRRDILHNLDSLIEQGLTKTDISELYLNTKA